MYSPYDTIKSLRHTEKGAVLEPQGYYQFIVGKHATKIEIKRAVEQIYKVSVKGVRTMVVPGKLKRVRQVAGKKPDWKKALVRLQEGQKIEVK